jgi:muramoyltetrapeptide carboxypeptidase
MPGMNRREFLAAAGAAALVAPAARPRAERAGRPSRLKPRRLAEGDLAALVAPASATFDRIDLQVARESLEALGLRVTAGGHLLDRHGYLAGADRDRAADINRAFADDSVKAVVPIRGGWGSGRLLPYLDYDTIRRNPKVVLGYSDITALHMAIQARTGLVTFHGPNGMGRWDDFSVEWVRRVLFDAEALTLENRPERDESLVPVENRILTITPGRATGPMLGGNLSIVASLIGSPYAPDFDGAILFLEDVGEDIYRVDRMLTTLKLAGVLDRIAGFVWGTCSRCEPAEGYASLTIDEILDDLVVPLKIPAWRGAMIGHGAPQFTVPEGIDVEIDAAAGTIRMKEPAVR